MKLEVREQERYIALQVRREVQERKERELQSLATALRDEWQKQRRERIQALEKLYKENLRDVGQSHRDATLNVRRQRARSVPSSALKICSYLFKRTFCCRKIITIEVQ